MKSAQLSRSPRLQRAHALLADGVERSTMEIISGARVAAVNSVVAELRDNGAVIHCRVARVDGKRRWLYRMLAPAPALFHAADRPAR